LESIVSEWELSSINACYKSDYEPTITANQRAPQCSQNQNNKLYHKSKIHYKMQARKDITFDHRLNPRELEHGFE
jgi:hypothetical protein